jgi:hypothetical protein
MDLVSSIAQRRVSCSSQPLEPVRWRNIVLLKSGRRIPGTVRHPSYEAARAAAARAEIHWAALAAMDVQVIELRNGSFALAEYSHCQQVQNAFRD